MNSETTDALREIARSAVRLLTAFDEDTQNGKQPLCSLPQIADTLKRDVDNVLARDRITA